MKNKRALSLLLAVMILLSSLPFAGVTAFADTSGDFKYELLNNGTVKITEYIGSDKIVEIPTKINGYTVTSIGAYAFWDYFNLTDLTIGSEVINISAYAFWGCSGLKNVTLPEKLTTIEEGAFEDCSSLTNIKIPKSVTDIGPYAFRKCKKLSSITFSGEVSHMGVGVLDNTAYYGNEANWENGMLYAGNNLIAANNTYITTATVKNGTVTIADEVFYKCQNLLNVIIPNSVKYIGEYAFYQCDNLKNVIMGNGIKEIGRCAFDFCDSFEIYYYGSKSQWNKIIIDDDNTWLLGATIHYNYDSNATLATPKIKSITNTFLGVQITWGEVKGALYYRVFRKTGNSGWVALGDTDTTNVIDISAESGNKYTYTVRCISSDGKTYLSSYDTAGKSIHYIEAPYITQVSNTATGIQVKWDKANGAAKYRVYYKTSNGNWTKIADTTSTSYTWTGAKSGTNYTFTVRCITSDGKSFTSDYDPFGLSLKYIAAPKISSLSNTATGIQINWGKVTGAEKYRVYYKTGNGSWTKIADTTGTSYTWTGAKAGTNYTFTVRCLTSDAKSFTSGYDTKGKSIKYITTPKISSVSAAQAGIQINWGKVTGAEKYRVYYKNSSGGWTKIADTTGASYTWTGAKAGTNYTFTVRCITSDGKSFTSGYDSTGKSLKYIASPAISSLESVNSGVKITWGKVSGAALYRVYYKNSSGGWTKIADTMSASYTWTGAKSGTNYTFTVRCLTSDAKVFTSGYDAKGKSIKYVATPKISSVSAAQAGIQINWGKVTGAEKYRVYYKSANGWTKIADTTGASYTWTGAKGGTNYTFTVRCITSDGKAFTSGYDSTGKSILFLSTPKLTSVSADNNGTVISWEKVSGAQKYRVYYKNTSGGWTKIADTTGTSYTWKGAKNGTNYTYTVRCITSDATRFTSGFDNKGISLKAVAKPSISSLSMTSTGISISWGKVTGAEKYRVYYKTGSGSWTKIADTTGASYTWTGAKSGTTYTFTVRCLTSDAKRFTSGFDTVGKSIKYIAAPKLSSVTVNNSGIEIKWNKVTGAALYRVYYKNSSGGWTKIVDTTSTYYTWTKANSGTNYTFTVRCLTADAKAFTSGFDSVGKSVKYVATPKLLSAVNIATGTLITWEKSPGAALYRVYYKNSSGGWTKIADTANAGYTWKGAKSGTNYTFTVRCLTSDGKTFTSGYDSKGKVSGTTFTTAKGYNGVVKNGVVYINGYLIANKTYPLPKNYGNGLTSEVNSAFKDMAAAARKDGLNIYISSGYRSYSLQDSLYTRYSNADGVKKADTYSARPGHSEHQSGLAFDVNIISDAFIGTPEAIWLEKNCYKYGFILRYVKGKTDETGYKYEPWHFRYVGKDLAKKLYNNGNWLTMEDYFGFTSVYY